MKVIAVITDSFEVRKILECLKRNNAPPFDKVEIKASGHTSLSIHQDMMIITDEVCALLLPENLCSLICFYFS
jgi:hypothetical protein